MMLRLEAFALGLTVALPLAACEQRNDVVAQISALGDAGAAGSNAPPEDPGGPEPTPSQGATDCTSPFYPLLTPIALDPDCQLPSDLGDILAILVFVSGLPMSEQTGEVRPQSTCDFTQAPFYSNSVGEVFLCPDHCARARKYVNDQAILTLQCQNAMMP